MICGNLRFAHGGWIRWSFVAVADLKIDALPTEFQLSGDKSVLEQLRLKLRGHKGSTEQPKETFETCR